MANEGVALFSVRGADADIAFCPARGEAVRKQPSAAPLPQAAAVCFQRTRIALLPVLRQRRILRASAKTFFFTDFFVKKRNIVLKNRIFDCALIQIHARHCFVNEITRWCRRNMTNCMFSSVITLILLQATQSFC
jgi:hypothetical protein